MLPDEVKNAIQSAYRQILESKSLTPRYGQRLKIAEIAKSLGQIEVPTANAADEDEDAVGAGEDLGGPICVIEAGTGTGKTLAYVLGTLPVAKYLNKTVILATATVALQEQIHPLAIVGTGLVLVGAWIASRREDVPSAPSIPAGSAAAPGRD
jgi:ATP-dependent DNA helicase DinG